jgi:hypothetical protein
VRAKSTGRSLLFHAALANDTEAVRLLLHLQDKAGLNVAISNPDLALGECEMPLVCKLKHLIFQKAPDKTPDKMLLLTLMVDEANRLSRRTSDALPFVEKLIILYASHVCDRFLGDCGT